MTYIFVLKGIYFMKEILFKGVGTAIATPFTDNVINFE